MRLFIDLLCLANNANQFYGSQFLLWNYHQNAPAAPMSNNAEVAPNNPESNSMSTANAAAIAPAHMAFVATSDDTMFAGEFFGIFLAKIDFYGEKDSFKYIKSGQNFF